MALVHPSSSPEFQAWRARVIAYARAVMGIEPEFAADELRDGFQAGDSPAEYCTGAIADSGDSIASDR